MLVTWHSLPTFVRHTMQVWDVPVSDRQDAAYLHLWQVSAHMLGIRDEYIPATWEDARRQSAEVLGPVLGPTAEGIDLADRLMDLPREYDQGATRPLLVSFTRYTIGDDLCDQMQLERYPEWEAAVRFAWPKYVAFRSGLMPAPLVPDVAWVLDEMIRRGVLAFLSDFKPIYIEIPDANRPS